MNHQVIGGRFPATRQVLQRLLGARNAAASADSRAHVIALADGARVRERLDTPLGVVDLREPLRAMPDICSTMLRGRGIALEHRLPASALPVLARHQGIQQLLMHVVAIACEAMQDGGTLQVLARAEGSQAVVSFMDAQPDGSASGLARLFDRPRGQPGHGEAVRAGTEASVVLCRHIANEHDGRIYAAPSPLGRMGVTLRLPLRGAVLSQDARTCKAA